MVVKNFVFRKSWVGSEVTSMKTAFFAIFDTIRTHILGLTSPNMVFLKTRILISNPLEIHKLYYYQLCDFRTD